MSMIMSTAPSAATSSASSALVMEANDFATWRTIMSHRFVPLEILPAHSASAPFSGRVVSRDFDGIQVSHIEADAHNVRRLAHTITPADDRHVKLTFQLAGTSILTQDDRGAEVGPGDLVIYETSRPYTVDATETVESFVVMMHPSELTVSREHLARLTAVRISPTSMVGECAHPFMRRFIERFEEVSQADGVRLIRAFVELVDAMLHVELGTLASEHTDFDRIRSYIDRRLADEQLTPAVIAKDNFISLRSLHYLFQERGTTVGQWIRGERLHRCRLDLADPALAAETAASIAARWGLSTATSFNRSFKQEFGQTPGEWRREALPR